MSQRKKLAPVLEYYIFVSFRLPAGFQAEIFSINVPPKKNSQLQNLPSDTSRISNTLWGTVWSDVCWGCLDRDEDKCSICPSLQGHMTATFRDVPFWSFRIFRRWSQIFFLKFFKSTSWFHQQQNCKAIQIEWMTSQCL